MNALRTLSLPQLSPSAQGILFMLAGVLVFTGMDAVAKALIERYDPLQVIWVRYLLMIPLIVAFNPRRLHRVLATRRPALHLTRVLFQMGAIACFFTALRHIGLASATAIADLAPCLITLGAALILREKIGPRRIAGVGVALIGALIIIRPGSDVFSPWAVLPLLCAVCFAGGAICSRKIGRDDSVWTSLSFSAVTGTLLGTLALPFVWTPPALGDLGLFLALGLLGSVGQLFFLRAFALAEASLIAPFAQTDLLFATLWGFLFFGELPDFWTRIGALVIVCAGLYVWHRETTTARAKLRDQG